MLQRRQSPDVAVLLTTLALLGLEPEVSPPACATESRQLWPCSEDASYDMDWRPRVLGVLFPGAASDASFRCVVIPAFDPEWAIVADCKRDGSATLEYRVAEENVWHANWVTMPTDEHPDARGWSSSPVPIKTKRHQVSLSYGTCVALRDLWTVVLEDPTQWGNSGLAGC